LCFFSNDPSSWVSSSVDGSDLSKRKNDNEGQETPLDDPGNLWNIRDMLPSHHNSQDTQKQQSWLERLQSFTHIPYYMYESHHLRCDELGVSTSIQEPNTL
jgi:hypothetical protein